jgi:NAD-dependent dihydropyrimidine dehydrogenase PreA subunit
MPGMFIDVKVDPKVAKDPESARRLEEVCPVDIFARREDGSLGLVEENLDECVLCDLCLEVGPPGSVRVVRLYAEE